MIIDKYNSTFVTYFFVIVHDVALAWRVSNGVSNGVMFNCSLLMFIFK